MTSERTYEDGIRVALRFLRVRAETMAQEANGLEFCGHLDEAAKHFEAVREIEACAGDLERELL